VEYITKYLARYVKRVAISDSRIVEVTDTEVSFRARRGIVTLDGAEFVHRFLLHVLPSGFKKARNYGLYAPSNVNSRLETARRLILAAGPNEPVVHEDPDAVGEEDEPAIARLDVCPACAEASIIHFHSVRIDFDPCSARGPP